MTEALLYLAPALLLLATLAFLTLALAGRGPPE